tara:strand:+ start:499 stop:672 length:174 start_codon:yes stop_codon:yes gene_type:complete
MKKLILAIIKALSGLSCKSKCCSGGSCECGNKKSSDSIDAESDGSVEEEQTSLQTST